MSTRATILIEEGKENFRIYHHCDGYLEGVGFFLKEILKKDGIYWTVEDITNTIIKSQDDKHYEITSCIHGDEEYFYRIDCKNKKLFYTNDGDEKEISLID